MDTNNSVNTQNMCMDWEDEIEQDGEQFVILEEGDYNFEVVNMERGRSKGGGKIPACNMATITMAVDAGDGKTATCRTNLLLYKTLEWKLSQFFRSIGMKKEGESVKMQWNKVIGSVGRAHFKPRKYTNNDGEEREANDVAYFIDYDEKVTPPKPEPDFVPFDEAKEELPFN
ncbi:MAG: hypothetical protein IJ229_06650 [Clostridia bacterium]|nr:hypothetical protein [Clostridia bacterium]